MNVLDPAVIANGTVAKEVDLGKTPVVARLSRRSRLYAAVVDEKGAPGQRHFLLDLAEGTAIFALVAPGVSFFLLDGAVSTTKEPLLADGPIDSAAIDLWYGALLSWPEVAQRNVEAAPMDPDDHRMLAAGERVTARRLLWLVGEGEDARLRYTKTALVEASAAKPLLVLADQVSAEAVVDCKVRAVETASLLAQHPLRALAELSTVLATRIAAHLVATDMATRSLRRERLLRDESEVSMALQRLRDIATFRLPARAVPAIGVRDPLVSALAVLAGAEGIELRMPSSDDQGAPLFDRIEHFGSVSGFRFREIALEGHWWKREGPSLLAIDAASGQPRAVIWRRRRWRILGSEASTETVVDGATASTLLSRGFMIYPLLPERTTTSELWRFATHGVRGDIGRLLAAAAATTLAGFLIPVATGAVLGFAVPDGRIELLRDMMILLVAAAFGSACFQLVRAIALLRLGTTIDRRLQAAVWDRVLRLKTSFFRDYSAGDLAQRILGIDAIRRILAGQAVNGLISGVFSLASLGIMLIYDASLAAFAVGYAVVAACLLFMLGRRQMRLKRIVYERKGAVTSLLIETLRGIAKLRVAAAELRAFSRWANAFAEQRRNDAVSGRLGVYQTVVATSLPILGAIGVFAIAAGGAHPLDVASFAAFNSAFGQFTAAFVGLTSALNVSIEAAPLFARARPVFEAPLEVDQSRVDPGVLSGRVAVRKLSFRYTPEGPWTLEDLDFEVRPGESIAIVGASGSGKSTLLRLLLGFETPVRGGVYYDDKDLETLDLRRLRRQIGAVLETASLVPGSIFENIAGSAPLSRDEVEKAVRLAGLDADIATMPMGLESFVMEGGSQLSGGQRQRVMIARALVNRPRLICFDQATSALDNRTQAIVGRSLAATNATRIIVAHRLSTIRHADRILVLEGGRIAETGTFDDLVGRNGAFHRLVQRQLL